MVLDRTQVFNFSSGPSMLPEAVLKRAGEEITNYKGSGMSVMEMSHRSNIYIDIFAEVKEKFKKILRVPDTHEILFLQGGASLQFSMVPLNLMHGSASYAVTGNFSSAATKEAGKYGNVLVACDTSDCKHTRIPAQSELKLDAGASYLHYCANNTIFGTEWKYIPEAPAPLVCDMSSNILSKPVDVSRYGLIYAGAQKNMAPAGLTVVVIDKALAGREREDTPLMLSYARMIDSDSMYNTPPAYNIYMLGLVLDWLMDLGGVEAMEKIKSEKTGLFYDFIDASSYYSGLAEKAARSDMNVTFTTGDEARDALFAKEAEARGLHNLKGHRIAGALRASIYNAMPVEGVRALIHFMEEFEKTHV